MFDTAKVIRVIGYVVYTILWLPAIILIALSLPIWAAVMCIRYDWPIYQGIVLLRQGFKAGIAHDKHFIETGIW